MIQRVRSDRHRKNYRDRGIGVCAWWRVFENFLQDMGERPSNLTLDRIDNNRGYEPGNCRWATHKEQNNNWRHNVRLQWNGENLTVAQWSERLGITPGVLYERCKKGWDPESILTTPVKTKYATGLTFSLNGETRPLREWAQKSGIPSGTLNARLNRGIPFEVAIALPVRRSSRWHGTTPSSPR